MKNKNVKLHTGFILLSLSAHLAAFYPAVTPGVLNFGPPVSLRDAVTVDLSEMAEVSSPAPSSPEQPLTSSVVASVPAAQASVAPVATHAGEMEAPPVVEPSPLPAAETAIETENPEIAEPAPKVRDEHSVIHKPPVVLPPLRRTDDFLSAARETLIYQVKLHGMPVGSAQLEASTTGGEFRISLSMKSSPVLAAVYPVQSQIETRHIGGNFIITKIKQQEGPFRSDKGFTLSLRDRSVFWADLLKRRSSTEKVPTSDVLDPFSALYYLRNIELQVGRTEKLHVYDGDSYFEMPVEVVRSEEISLSRRTQIQTLVLKPQLPDGSVFRRKGEMLVWVTADNYKIPVKFQTSIALGLVTAELIAAETTPHQDQSRHTRKLPIY